MRAFPAGARLQFSGSEGCYTTNGARSHETIADEQHGILVEETVESAPKLQEATHHFFQ